MNFRSVYIIILLILPGFLNLGCHSRLLHKKKVSDQEPGYQQLKWEESYTSHTAEKYEHLNPSSVQTQEPWTVRRELPEDYLDLTLEEALQIALQNATILHDLGGTVLSSPATIDTVYDRAVTETDPQLGVEAALSQFDARLRSNAMFQNNDRPFNNFFVGGGTQLFQQDAHDYLLELSKKTATGTQFSARSIVDYDDNNRAQNLYPNSWGTQVEMEVRQPLMQGAGTKFNRIAGPYGRPGVIEGIVIARINTDMAISEFEIGMRDFISNVENAYWDLFYAYRLLDTSLAARDQSLKTWKSTISRIDQKGITAAKEAQAREQYYRFEEDMYNALAGRQQNATQTGNGSRPGTFTGAGGLYVAERRLRLLMGLPMKEESVIRPVSEPKVMPIEYDWNALIHEAIAQRPELKKQRQALKSLELQKEASQQFKKPRLDMFGRYRFRGFGDNLIGDTATGATTLNRGATENLFGGDFQEWELGVEMTVPIGTRQGHAAVTNLEIQIARERALLRQQERQIAHDLSNAVAELERAQELNKISFNRLISAQQRFSSLNEDTDSPDEILDAQSRLADAKASYYRSLVEHEAALRNIHFEKGSLLPFRHVILTDNYSTVGESHWNGDPSRAISIGEVEPQVPLPATSPLDIEPQGEMSVAIEPVTNDVPGETTSTFENPFPSEPTVPVSVPRKVDNLPPLPETTSN
ncbi:TolC family protein, partial [bacterium]|nr:TolC family protein [bacterium]